MMRKAIACAGGLMVLISSSAAAIETELPARGICAHRGASDTHPENTLAAFREAIRLGVQMVEFDVALSADGHAVLMHDTTVNRTTNGTGRVSDLTLKQLQALDAGSWKAARFKGERVPTLAEGLAVFPRNIWLNVHLKGGPKVAAEATRQIAADGRLHQAFLACGAAAAKAARRIDPRIQICNMDRQANSLTYVQETIAMDADFIQLLGGKSVDPAHTALLREQGVRINYCCTNDAGTVAALFRAGVEFPLVDRVAAMLKVADAHGIKRLQPDNSRRTPRLIRHWKLEHDARDSLTGRAAANQGVRFDNGAARFDGHDDWLEVPVEDAPKIGNGEFSIAVQIHTEKELDDVLGDVLSQFDPKTRQGFNLSLMNYAGVTSAQSNWRNVFFGIDAGQVGEWTDCGRPGTNMQVKSLVVFKGDLYAAVWEPDAGKAGHVYRYAGGTDWVDCGSPDKANALCGMAVYDGRLYVGSELYSGGGSSLPLSPNENHGGRVYRYEGPGQWTDMGKVADVRSVSGLAVYKGKLYAGTGTTGAWRDTPRTRGMYRFDGPGRWTSCGCPDLRVVHLSVHNGSLFGLSYDAGGFFRYNYEPSDWTKLGPVPETTQVYSTAVYQGRIHAGTWPTGSVYRYEGPQEWTHVGRLGNEKEVMGMTVYNGKLYAGTLPLAEVYRYDGTDGWTSTGRVDTTPNVRYRRAWVTAVYKGRLFCGTLPSGRVKSLEAGKAVTYDQALSPGWHHLVAVKDKQSLELYIDGRKVAHSTSFDPARYRVHGSQPLKIGFGQHDHFNGQMKDLRIYKGALSSAEVSRLHAATQ